MRIVWDMWESRKQTLLLKEESWGYWWATRTRLPSSALSSTLFILFFSLFVLLISGFGHVVTPVLFFVRQCVYKRGGIETWLLLALTGGGMSSAVCDFQVSLGVSLTRTEGIEIVCLFSAELWLWETPGFCFVSSVRMQTHRRSGQQSCLVVDWTHVLLANLIIKMWLWCRCWKQILKLVHSKLHFILRLLFILFYFVTHKKTVL